MSDITQEIEEPPMGVAHLVRIRGRLDFSGPNAGGHVAAHGPVLYRVDCGGECRLSHDGLLFLPRLRPDQGFTPGGLLLAARAGMFGLRVLEGTP